MPDQMERFIALTQPCSRIMHRLKHTGRLVAACAVVAFVTIADAAAQERIVFDIDAGPAARSLNAYARQADVQIGFTAELVDSARTNAVKGAYDPAQALLLLLEGTGLTAEQGTNGLVVRHAEPGRADTPAGPGHATRPDPDPDNTASRAGDPESPAPVPGDRKLEEIVVTGTQIRDTAPVGANVITFDRTYIEMSGLGTTHQILETIPQTFGGGTNEDTMATGVGPGTNNLAFSSSVNLRGLGSDSTLLLVNGRRSAAGGVSGNFVDPNSIPSAAIERIEVLADGASAIYGSDAIGGVVNIVLRDEYEGAQTRLRYAPGTSDITESRFSQVFGKSWARGNVLLTYEHYDRSELEASDRAYLADSDLRSLGGSNHSHPGSNPGNIIRYTASDGTRVNVQYAIPAGQDGTSLSFDDLLPGTTNLQNTQEGTWGLPKQTRNTVALWFSQALGDRLDLFLDSRYSERDYEQLTTLQPAAARISVPSSNPWFIDLDPSGGAQELLIHYSFGDDFGPPRLSGKVATIGGTAGIEYAIGNTWRLNAYGSYNSEKIDALSDRRPNTFLLAAALADPNPDTAFNPFGDGSHTNPQTLEAIAGYGASETESVLKIVNAQLDGALFNMSGGEAKLAIGGQFRSEALSRSALNFRSTPEPVESTAAFDLYDLSRDVTAAFAELYLPLTKRREDGGSLGALAVSLAVRHERYSDFGDTLDPKLGISWSPIDSVNLRGTVGTSFRAPLLKELDDSNRVLQTLSITALGGPAGLDNVLLIAGNSPDLKSQEGTTWTAGLDLTPQSWPGFSFALTYFSTEVDDLIDLPVTNIVVPFREPGVYASILTFDPDDSVVAQLLAEPNCFCTGTDAADVEAIMDIRNGNLARVELSGIDLQVRYRWETAMGDFETALYGSELFEFREQLVGGPLLDKVDTLANPNSTKLRGMLAWRNNNVTAAISANYIGQYTDDLSDPFRSVSSWTTWDMSLAYTVDEAGPGLLSNCRIGLSVQNLLNEDPPFLDEASGYGYDSNNANPLGRYVALEITKDWCSVGGC